MEREPSYHSNQERREQMPSVLAFEWESHIPYKKEREDALFTDESRSVLVVTDGVTRLQNEQGKYPYPSPAHQAAQVAAVAIGKSLTHREQINESAIQEALVEGNQAVKQLNEQLGLWENHDYLVRDFAGTVAACSVERDGEILYGYIGDCGVAHLSADGEVLWHSDDDVTTDRPSFPKIEEVVKNERFVRVRRDFRNNPSASHPTFGVLTGEETALSYIKTGHRQFAPEDTLVVFSDGAAPFVLEDIEFRRLLMAGNREVIQRYVDERSSPQNHADEKTLILLRRAQ
jgi:hypothetical protein